MFQLRLRLPSSLGAAPGVQVRTLTDRLATRRARDAPRGRRHLRRAVLPAAARPAQGVFGSAVSAVPARVAARHRQARDPCPCAS